MIAMKKILLMAAVVIMAATSVKAQNGYEDTKHEIGITYGWLSNSNIIDLYENVGGAIVGVTMDNDKYSGPASVEYFYHVKPWLGVGGIMTYGMMEQDVFYSKKDSKVGTDKNHYISLLPAVKLDWLRKKNFGMYSKVAVGATLRSEETEYDDKTIHDDYSNSEMHFNWHLTLVGMEAGSPTTRGFLELGVGEQGMFLVGLRQKF